MPLWYRIFGRSCAAVPKSAVVDCMRELGTDVAGDFDGGETDWFQATLTCGALGTLVLERFLATEEGIRAELNTWAAFLETCAYNSNI